MTDLRRPALAEISREDCLALLGQRTVGRIAVPDPGGGPLIVPVNYVFDGGCVVYRYRFTGNAPPTLALQAEEALSFLPRTTVIDEVEAQYDQILCGAGAPPCEA